MQSIIVEPQDVQQFPQVVKLPLQILQLLTGLQENIGYQFRLTATNSAGTSTPDAVYKFTMPSACKN